MAFEHLRVGQPVVSHSFVLVFVDSVLECSSPVHLLVD